MRAAEPNGYYLPEWELAVNASARGRLDAAALGAWRDASALDRPAAGDLDVARLQNPPSPPWSAPIPTARFARRCSIATWRKMPLPTLCSRPGGPAHALILRATSLDGAAMKAFADVLHRGGMQPHGAAVACPRLPRRDRRRRRSAARVAGRKETEGTAPSAQSPRRTRRCPLRGGADTSRNYCRRRSLPDAGGQRLEGPARHRAQPGRRRCGLRPPRDVSLGRDRPVRDR